MKAAVSFLLLMIFFAGKLYAQLPATTTDLLLNNAAVKEGHIGVSVFNVNTGTYLYNYNAERYFTPASNQKIFTLYAGLSTLGDSLASAVIYNTKDKTYLQPLGDPSFLLQEFAAQPLLEYLKKDTTPIVEIGRAHV